MKFKEYITEAPDQIQIKDKVIMYSDKNEYTYPFLYCNNKLFVGGNGTTHAGITQRRNLYWENIKFRGRVWSKQKLISFWDFPTPEKLAEIIADLNKEDMKITKDWKIELPTNIAVSISKYKKPKRNWNVADGYDKMYGTGVKLHI